MPSNGTDLHTQGFCLLSARVQEMLADTDQLNGFAWLDTPRGVVNTSEGYDVFRQQMADHRCAGG